LIIHKVFYLQNNSNNIASLKQQHEEGMTLFIPIQNNLKKPQKKCRNPRPAEIHANYFAESDCNIIVIPA